MQGAITESNWSVHWKLTESSGLALYLASYRGRRAVWEASLPYVTVDHQRPEAEAEPEPDRETIEEPGEPAPSHGTMSVLLGARTLASEVRHTRFRGGFEIAADFVSGPFRATQMWRLHKDGRLAAWLTLHEGGVHGAHTYHPHWRLDLDVDGAEGDAFEVTGEAGWERVTREGWFPAGTDGKSRWRQLDTRSGRAVSIRPHKWDDADLFAVRYHDDEWPPLSPHTGDGGHPYPAAYVGRESVDGHDVTLWYVAHVHHGPSFPFTAGPLLHAENF